ncbi:hypothetical protein IFT54_05590 [Sphingomonas sp. CFBP 13714]|uniref:Abi-alpha family protein n=1 Tax=Sphingomonas sp. CFBP 13714 TaxID=2775308 RepID=UPI0017877726|nr:Abi-alpha family protein [Sphingomonas sp. CFBP 13714]MBD8699287.1 hypothetical protein [Sphingomonas sp. CFBP 13714]
MDALGLGKAIDLVRDMMAPVGGTLSETWSALIGDRVAYWRAKNAMKYRPLLTEEASRLGLKLNAAKIPDKFAFAWFEEATKQDEPEIQILFARLLARAADADSSSTGDRRMIDILARLTPGDALLFQRLYSNQPFPDTGSYSDTKGIGHESEKGWPVDWLTSLLGHVHVGYDPVSLENLVLQGCLSRSLRLDFSRSGGAVATPTPKHIAWGKEIADRVKQREYIEATDLGIALYASVKE